MNLQGDTRLKSQGDLSLKRFVAQGIKRLSDDRGDLACSTYGLRGDISTERSVGKALHDFGDESLDLQVAVSLGGQNVWTLSRLGDELPYGYSEMWTKV